jgi:hypothetical protein
MNGRREKEGRRPRIARTDAWSGGGGAWERWLRSGRRSIRPGAPRRLLRLLLPALVLAGLLALVWALAVASLVPALRLPR